MSQEDQKKTSVFRHNGEKIDADLDIKKHDFSNALFFSDSQKRYIKSKQDKFALYLASRLNTLLKSDLKIKIKDPEIMSFSAFQAKALGPKHIALFNFNLSKKIAILSLETGIALSIINKMLGGKGLSFPSDRVLTDIEVGLIDEVLNLILSEFSDAWKDTIETSYQILGKDNDFQFLSVIEKNTSILIMELEVQLAEAKGIIHLIIPTIIFEEFTKKINLAIQKYALPTAQTQDVKWSEAYSNITVPLFAEMEIGDISVKDFVQFKVGHIINIPQEKIASAQIRVMNRKSFLGELGNNNGKLAVRVNSKLLK